MPNVNNKGVNVPVWLLSIIVGVALTVIGALYSQQTSINKETVETLYKIQKEMTVNSINNTYILQRLDKNEAKDEQQDKDIIELKQAVK